MQPIAAIGCVLDRGGLVVRIRDIAQRAGVSTTTVSHVLNSSRHVHPDTEARVLKAVEELNYHPNMLARSLRRRETHTFGLLVSDIENPFFTEMAHSVETTAYERGYNVILCNTDEELAKEILYVRVLFSKQIDGLILAPAPGDHSYLKPYLASDARVVFVNRYIEGIPTPAVICDDADSTYALASRLLGAGHRHIGVLVGLNVSTTQQRIAGLERALREYGLSLSDVWVCEGQSRREGGYQAAM
jgi:LacI family transcriptional regulator